MSKKKTVGVIFVALVSIYVLWNVAVINGDNYAIEREQSQKQIWINHDIKRCNELYNSGAYSGYNNQPQNDQAQQQQRQACIERAHTDADNAWKSMQNYNEQQKIDYEKDVWKIKNKHYASLRHFQGSESECVGLATEISEIKSTSKTNWSPLDKQQWSKMHNDFVTKQREHCT